MCIYILIIIKYLSELDPVVIGCVYLIYFTNLDFPEIMGFSYFSSQAPGKELNSCEGWVLRATKPSPVGKMGGTTTGNKRKETDADRARRERE